MHQSPPYVSGCAHQYKSQHTNVWYDSEVENPTFPCKEACTLHTCYAAVLDFWIRFGIIQQGKTNIFGLPLFLDTVFSIFKGRNMSWAVEILRLSTQALSLCLPDPNLSFPTPELLPGYRSSESYGMIYFVYGTCLNWIIKYKLLFYL